MLWAFLVLPGIVFVLWIKYQWKRSDPEAFIEMNILSLKEDTEEIIKIVQEFLRENERSTGILGSIYNFIGDILKWWSEKFGTLLENMEGNEIELKPWNDAFTDLENKHKCIKTHELYKTAKEDIINKVKKIIDDKKDLPRKLREFDEEWNQCLRKLTFGLY